MTRQTVNFIRAILDGMTGAGLFRRLSYPGAPRYAVDPRPIYQIVAHTPGLQNLKDRVRSEWARALQHQYELQKRENVEKATHHSHS